MNKPKNPMISVIVPVYNVENCLIRCLNSILNQANQNFELLLIDDGSTDKSGKICDEYAFKDSRIHVFHKNNNGVSSARNFGLENSHGVWVAFVDSDDELSQDYLSINENLKNADVIQKSYLIIDDDSDNRKAVNLSDTIIDNKKDLFRFFTEKRNNALWDKLIKRSIINDTRFLDNVHIGEDFLFFFSIVNRIKTYAICQQMGYMYHVRSNSVMHSINTDYRNRVLFENIDNIREIAKQQNIDCLGEGIITHTYLALLYSNRSDLSEDQKILMIKLFRGISLTNLKFLSAKNKMKFVSRKISLFFFK